MRGKNTNSVEEKIEIYCSGGLNLFNENN